MESTGTKRAANTRVLGVRVRGCVIQPVREGLYTGMQQRPRLHPHPGLAHNTLPRSRHAATAQAHELRHNVGKSGRHWQARAEQPPTLGFQLGQGHAHI